MPSETDVRCYRARGCGFLPVAALLSALATAAPPAAAQYTTPTPPKVTPAPLPPPGAGGVGGGAGLIPTLPDFRPLPTVPAAPSVSPPVAPAAPAPAPIIRFRCEGAPGSDTCKEQPLPDGGGETCDCARDFCYADGNGARICEKP